MTADAPQTSAPACVHIHLAMRRLVVAALLACAGRAAGQAGQCSAGSTFTQAGCVASYPNGVTPRPGGERTSICFDIIGVLTRQNISTIVSWRLPAPTRIWAPAQASR